MAKSSSEVVGLAERVGKSRVTVDRALKPLECAACGEPLKEGALFTRRSLFGQGLRLLPHCQKCVSFKLRAAGEKERRPAALLEALLRAEPEPS